ncbi:MAG TPA: cbb3-type cytochrome c oxidase subunit I, partial [Pirellulaceae bacterium]|nr:cbb3-type cytochrome c oxidase subunit I [Pirellulaceae bacterium]
MRRLWLAFALVLIASFAVLGWIGVRIHQEMPPIVERVVTADGEVVIDSGEITAGQNVWQTLGGMEVGSIWGHGSYVAPDWTADYLHREATFVLDAWSRGEFDASFDELSPERQGQLTARLTSEFRDNTYDPSNGTLTIGAERAAAFRSLADHYRSIFIDGQDDYSIPAGTVSSEARTRKLTAFFFWTSWSAAAARPGDSASYTGNWPHEPLVGNRPTGDNVVWTGVSIIMLLAGISAMTWWYASRPEEDETAGLDTSRDPLARWQATPSQRATVKFFWVVAALILAQMGLGVVVAHYGVEGNGFYGLPLADWLPYSVARTWHVQIGLFWIATAWLAAGLFIGPLVSEAEPKLQRFGVNVLFAALLLVVVGSLAGEWMSVKNFFSDQVAFYFGHQGYEYVDLGRFWQILLMVGLLLWLVLMIRALLPALRRPGHQRQLVLLLTVATAAIALFYGAGLTWGRHTHLSMVEYWRWWVVHLWVEGFFEVFATTVIAFVFMRLGLIR